MPPVTRDTLVADVAEAIQHAQDRHPLDDWPPTYDVDTGRPTPYGVLVAETALDRLTYRLEPYITALL